MKWINRAVALAAVLSLSALSAWAQAKECNDDFKTATYSKWYDNRKDNQDAAYEAAKEYLAVCTTEDQYSAALKKFVADYDKIHNNQKLATDFEAAVKGKNYAEQIRLGKQLVAQPSHADNAVIYIIMAGAGLGDANLLAEASNSAKKAIELIEANKPFAPAYQTRDQALAAMNYVVAKSMMKTSPTDAITYFIKAAKYESDLKKSPLVYNELAGAYGEGPVSKLTEDYKKFIGQPESTESKLVLANLNQALDRQIDAYARAAALSSNAADKKAVMDTLTELYEFRNKTKDGVDQLVAGVLAKPLPDAPAPITTLPTQSSGPAPAGSGAAPAAGNAGNGAAGTGTSSSTANKPAATGTSNPTTSKPAASPTPKPKPRRANHRRG